MHAKSDVHDFQLRVIRWSKSFDRKYQRWAWAFGSCADLENHECVTRKSKIAAKYAKAFKCKQPDDSTVRRNGVKLRDMGILEIEERYQPDSYIHPGRQMS